MAKQKKKFTTDFKLQVLKQWKEGNLSAVAIASKHGFRRESLYQFEKELTAKGLWPVRTSNVQSITHKAAQPKVEHLMSRSMAELLEENSRLYAKVGQLMMRLEQYESRGEHSSASS